MTQVATPGVAHTGTVLPPTGEAPELVRLASVAGGVNRGWIDTVGQTLEQHPEESLRVVKSWLAED